jgi:3-hydroxyisobutyrate dehydrogenase
MGHGMAKNLREKLPPTSNLIIYDISEVAMTRFVSEFGGGSNIIEAKSPREVAEHAVTVQYLSRA